MVHSWQVGDMLGWGPAARLKSGLGQGQLDNPTTPGSLSHGLLSWKIKLRPHVSEGC